MTSSGIRIGRDQRIAASVDGEFRIVRGRSPSIGLVRATETSNDPLNRFQRFRALFDIGSRFCLAGGFGFVRYRVTVLFGRWLRLCWYPRGILTPIRRVMVFHRPVGRSPGSPMPEHQARETATAHRSGANVSIQSVSNWHRDYHEFASKSGHLSSRGSMQQELPRCHAR